MTLHGLQTHFSKLAVLLEQDRTPFQIYAIKTAIKTWERIKSKQTNVQLYTSYQNKQTYTYILLTKTNKHTPIHSLQKQTNIHLYTPYKNKQTYTYTLLTKTNKHTPIHFLPKQTNVHLYTSFQNKQTNIHLYTSYQNAIKDNLPWVNNIKTLLDKNGMACFYINYMITNRHLFIRKSPRNCLISFTKKHLVLLRTQKVNYGLLVKQIGIEIYYLYEITNPIIWHSCTKLRLSNHWNRLSQQYT